jgi:hypothetical protein
MQQVRLLLRIPAELHKQRQKFYRAKLSAVLPNMAVERIFIYFWRFLFEN